MVYLKLIINIAESADPIVNKQNDVILMLFLCLIYIDMMIIIMNVNNANIFIINNVMILREIFYFDKETIEPIEDKTYDATDDKSIVNRDDTRKTRLTLRQINKARTASEIHSEEKDKELAFVRQMYGISSQPEAV